LSKVISPFTVFGSWPSGFSGSTSSAARIVCTRSTATAACAIELVILARSCTGLKNLERYERKTVSAPIVIAPARISEAPR
jgi:hypothetical protein